MTTEPLNTVTDDQIRTLRREARAAGDMVQAAICLVALTPGSSADADVDESVRADLKALGIVPGTVGSDAAARELCAEVINEARASVTAPRRESQP